MRKILVTIIALLSAIPFVSKAQTWSGSTPGNVYYNSGNVGIGTTAPNALLDVGGLLSAGQTSTVLGRLAEGNTTGGGTFLGVKVFATQGTTDIKSFSLEHSFYGQTNSSINFFRGGGMVGGYMSFCTSENNERMRIDPSGNISIGTTDAQGYKLAVNGNMIAEAVTVKLHCTWPDYVFDRANKLPSLTEIKTFVDRNHHLPEIPTAVEMAKNGIDLGDMNTKLLKKVEELTLYLIEKDKEVKDQNRLILSLEKRLEVLEQKK